MCYGDTFVTTCVLFDLNISSHYHHLQELERLKAEVESANEFQSQKDSLTQKLQVSEALCLDVHVIANTAFMPYSTHGERERERQTLMVTVSPSFFRAVHTHENLLNNYEHGKVQSSKIYQVTQHFNISFSLALLTQQTDRESIGQKI